MRTLYIGLFVSLDGVAEAPDRFVSPHIDDAVGAEVSAGMASTDTVLLGRRLYQEWSAYWPGRTAADDPYAEFINPVRKVVISTTLESVGWQNCTLVRDDVAGTVARLKAEDGGDIAINGSITLARTMLAAGLVDELRLLVFPVVVGSGRRLFDGLDRMPLRLIEARPLSTGVVSLTYAPGETPARP
jgi:dihydrofolate reductase